MTAAAAGWSPLRMPTRPAWLGEKRQPQPITNRPSPIVCDPPYMVVCPGAHGARCRAIIPRHLPTCPTCATNTEAPS